MLLKQNVIYLILYVFCNRFYEQMMNLLNLLI